MGPQHPSIDVSALDEAVTALEDTRSGLEGMDGLLEDFRYFGVDTSNLNTLLAAKRELDDVVPDIRRRQELAVQLLSEQPANFEGDVVTFTGDILNDDELAHRADVSESIRNLQDAGLLDGDPGENYEFWVSSTLNNGLAPEEIVERAQQEGVTAETFDALDGVEYFTDPDGNRYYTITDSGTSEEIGRLTELINGGEPSLTADRREANSWTYDDDVDLVLNNGGAIVSTPEGILMTAPGPSTPVNIPRLPFPIDIPNPADLLSFSGGTAWGDMYVINGSFDGDPTPEEVLQEAVENNAPPPGSGAPSLDRLLRHEAVHSDQWAEHGHPGFLIEYFGEHVNWVSVPYPPFRIPVIDTDPCNNRLEEEAGFADGGYSCG